MLAQALYAAPIVDINAKKVELLNTFARRQFRLPVDTSSVFLPTELDILPMDYLVWRSRLRFALSFFRSPFFRTCIRPLLALPTKSFFLNNTHVALEWLITALHRDGLSLQDMLANAADASITASSWALETTRIVRRSYSQTWPQVATTGAQVQGALAQHLALVCRRRHLPTELAALHPITGHLPCGLQTCVKLGGLSSGVGLIFNAFSLRPAFASGLAHHDRAACLWCEEAGTECGAHMLTCPKASAGVKEQVQAHLHLVIDKAQQPAGPPGPEPRARAQHAPQ